jgi:hypothetical protein
MSRPPFLAARHSGGGEIDRRAEGRMSHVAEEGKSAEPFDDDGFVHSCYCGKWGFFGYDVALLMGRIGTWFCAEHRPDDEAGLEFAGALA